MVGAMLVGAWILIHQQCCVTGEIDSRGRNSLFDPLTRRSALEKNFMRYGRSLLSNDIEFNQNETKVKINFMTFGTSKANDLMNRRRNVEEDELEANRSKKSNNEKSEYSRAGRDKNCFMRFGRGEKGNFDRLNRDADNFLRFGRNKDVFMRFGKKNDDFLRFGKRKDDFLRFGKRKDDFLRFGKRRDDFPRWKKKKMNFLRFGRNDKNFMRFGRAKYDLDFNRSPPFVILPKPNQVETYRIKRSLNDNLLHNSLEKELMRFNRQKQMDKDGFIRFGRSLDGSAKKVDPLKTPNLYCQIKEIKEEKNFNECLLNFDPNYVFLQDIALLQQILVKSSPAPPPNMRNFMRRAQ